MRCHMLRTVPHLVIPQVAVSGDGNTVAGCDLVGPVPDSRFPIDPDAAYHPARSPQVFNFATGKFTYPRDGAADPQTCGSVSLDTSGAQVWWSQSRASPGWFSSGTLPITLIDGIAPVVSLTPARSSSRRQDPPGPRYRYPQ